MISWEHLPKRYYFGL